MIEGLRLLRRIFAAPPLAPAVRDELMPGGGHESDEDLTHYLRANAQIDVHPVGTCRMGRTLIAFVDSRLRVHGVGGLRVVDASIMPRIPSVIPTPDDHGRREGRRHDPGRRVRSIEIP